MKISAFYNSNNPFPLEAHLKVTVSEDCNDPARQLVLRSDSTASSQTTKASTPLKNFCLSRQHCRHPQKKYLLKIATDLRFSQEVVKHRGLQSLSYKEYDFKGLYDASDIIQNSKRKDPSAKIVKQTTHKLCPLKQPPHHMKLHFSSPKDTAVEVPMEKRLQRGKPGSSLKESSLPPIPPSSPCESPASETFLTEPYEMVSSSMARRQTKRVSTDNIQESESKAQGWEQMLLEKLSRSTAQWIVNQQTVWGGWIQGNVHGFKKQEFDWSRIRDEISSESELRLLDTIQAEEDAVEVSPQSHVEKKPETLLPVYYRIPAYCPRVLRTDDPVGTNSTAHVKGKKCLKPTSPLKNWEQLNSRVGKYSYATKNTFEQELYFGTVKIVHQVDERGKDRFIMENHDEYYKHLQQHFPRPPEHWSFKSQKGTARRPVRGAFRWTALPTLADDFAQRGQESSPAKVRRVREKHKEPKGVLPQHARILRTMLEQWKHAWKLNPRWQNATIEGLMRALTGIHDVSRVTALITCATAVLERRRLGSDSQESVVGLHGIEKASVIEDVPVELQPLLRKTLRDENVHVRMASAVCHYTIGLWNDEARMIMKDALEHGNSADSWAAAQCLALEGTVTFPVVKKILSQMFDKSDDTTEEQACLLLTQLSESSSLVYSLLAAKLNSCQWRDRILACRALSRIRGCVSQDLKNKLAQLMWNDWNSEVRQAAAMALGHMKLGKEVHDQLRVKLNRGDCRMKVEALSLIAWLRLMTAKLLPGFLQCFSNDFVAVRREACITAGALRIKDEMVLTCLFKMMQTDPHWKIKAFAIRALGQIGDVTPQLKHHLLWALHHEEKPRVRREACRSIVTLQLKDESVRAILMERLILEPDEMVREEMNKAVKALNFQPTDEQEMIQKIKNEISRLSQKDLVTQKLMKLEEILDHLWQEANRIYHAKEQCSSAPKDIMKNITAVLGSTFSGQSCSNRRDSKICNPDSNLPSLVKISSSPRKQEAILSSLEYHQSDVASSLSGQSTPVKRGQSSRSLCRKKKRSNTFGP
ncbi:HEAT repeat-containing protein 4 [Carettochelys insculpta]|uniref:HEAT repeat-containing protein 4 n=1 Tax=Carettochelys insculpta TaxID=44489 RepID=UPI003EB9B4A0